MLFKGIVYSIVTDVILNLLRLCTINRAKKEWFAKKSDSVHQIVYLPDFGVAGYKSELNEDNDLSVINYMAVLV